MECKCYAKNYPYDTEIEYCPKHKAAPDLYEAVKLALDETPWKPLGDDIKDVLRKAKAKAEGKDG